MTNPNATEMSVLDLFAAHAMQALIEKGAFPLNAADDRARLIAGSSYIFAKDMLKARKRALKDLEEDV